MKNIGFLYGIVMLAAGCSTESTGPFDPLHDEVVLTAASPTSFSVVAGNSVSDVPAVIAQDRNGTPQPGVIVQFTLSVGTTVVDGGRDTTDASGIARWKKWTPEPKAGATSRLTASTANGQSVLFSAIVIAGPAAKMLKLAGDNQIAAVYGQVAIKPVVQVTDLFGNPTRGVQVRFDVLKGGGTITPNVATTDSLGNVGLASWTLGDSGEQLVVASVGTFAQAFHATAFANLSVCNALIQLTPGTLSSELTSESCVKDGRYFTIYHLSVATESTLLFEMQSSDFDTYLELRDSNFQLIASNDNIDPGTKDSRLGALLPAGGYQLVVFSNSPGVAGEFSVVFGNATSPIVGCDGVFVLRGTATSGQIAPRNCNGVTSSQTDRYRLHLAAGTTLVVTMVDKSYSGYDLSIVDSDGKQLVIGQNTLNYLTYGATYTADSDIDVVVLVSSQDTGSDYTIEFR
jgi:hypothetical protein